MNGNYCAERKNVEIPVDQIGQNTKNELLEHKISHIDEKRQRQYFRGYIYQLQRVTS